MYIVPALVRRSQGLNTDGNLPALGIDASCMASLPAGYSSTVNRPRGGQFVSIESIRRFRGMSLRLRFDFSRKAGRYFASADEAERRSGDVEIRFRRHK